MSNKAVILFSYFVAVYIILSHWYKKQGNSGMPYPTTITAPAYLYGVLALVSDFTGGLGTVLAVGMTFGLYYATRKSGNGSITIPGTSVAIAGGTGAKSNGSITSIAVEGGNVTISKPKKKAKK